MRQGERAKGIVALLVFTHRAQDVGKKDRQSIDSTSITDQHGLVTIA